MATLTITNNTHTGSSDFYVSDRWTVQIGGAAPNSAVTNTATKDGGAPGTWTYGTTDADGNATIVGTMGREDMGSWVEVWKVGGVQVPPTLTFRVRALPVAASELPADIVEEWWQYGASNPPMPSELFVSDDLTAKALPSNFRVGMVRVGGWAVPFNLCSGSVGRKLAPRRRVVYAY